MIRTPGANLVCYRAKLAKKHIPEATCGCSSSSNPTCDGEVTATEQAKHTRRKGIYTANQFGPEQLDTIKDFEVCIPSEIMWQPL